MASYPYSWESPYPYPSDVYGQFSVNNFYGYAPSFEEQYRQPSTTHEDPEGSDVFNSWSSGGACEEKEEVSIFYKHKYMSDLVGLLGCNYSYVMM